MIFIILYLIKGKLSLNNLAGPIGIFNIVGEAASAGFINIIYLMGYISVNVGFAFLAIGLLCMWRHRGNIVRLIAGTESKIEWKWKK